MQDIRDPRQPQMPSLGNRFDDPRDHPPESIGFGRPASGGVQCVGLLKVLNGFFELIEVLMDKGAIVVEVRKGSAGGDFARGL